jgi:hypothetical protein
MSLHQHRKPLLRFENSERAQLISSSMPASGKRRKRSGKTSSTSKKPRVVKGKVTLRVAGYSGVQKLSPSALIPYLPANKLKQAAKRALGASGKKKSVRRKRKSKKGGKRR